MTIRSVRDATTHRLGIASARRLIAAAMTAALLAGALVAVDVTVAPSGSARAATYPVSAMPQDGFGFAGMRLLSSTDNPQTFYAYTTADESVAFLFDKVGDNNRAIDIRVTSPSGAVSTARIPATGQNSLLHGFGAGTLPKEEGIWTAELVPVGGALSNGNSNLFAYSAVYAPDGSGGPTLEKPGRVWTNRLQLYQPTSGGTFTVYDMSSLGYVYEVSYDGYWGLNSAIAVDGVGIVARNPDGTPNCSVSMYRSATGADTRISPIDPHAMPANGECGSIYRIFFSPPFQDDPAGTIPAATPHPGASPANPDGSPNDWVRPMIEPPSFQLTNYVGTSPSSAAGLLKADVENFFGSAVIEVLDRDGTVLRTFTVNVPEGNGVREVDLPFDGLDQAGNPIATTSITTFRVRGLNAGEIHFVGTDVESVTGGVEVRALNGPVAGTPEATRVYWADADGYDGTPAQPGVNTRDDGVLSAGGVRRYTYRQSFTDTGATFGDGMHTEMWTRQGVASQSMLTLHDPLAEYTMTKSVSPARKLLPGERATFTVTVANVSDVDLWDLWASDDLNGVLDDADYAGDVALSGSWVGTIPTPGTASFDAATGLLELRLNVPAHETVTVTYSAVVREDDADRGDDVLDNIVAAADEMPQPLPCAATAPECRETHTPVKDLRLAKTLAGQPVQHTDGSWTVEYLLTAHNLGAETEDVTVSDALRFGAGITTLAAEATAADPATPAAVTAWDGDAQQTIYAGPVPADAVYTYRITVGAEVAADVVGSPSGACPASPTAAGGFHNSAALTSPATPAVDLADDACGEPARPAMQKALVGFEQDADGSWSLQYRILVTNASASALAYDIDDTLHFGPGATVTSAQVTGSPAGVTLATPNWNGDSDTAIATGVTLPAATSAGPTVHEYTLSVVAELGAGADLGAPAWQCPDDVSAADQAFNNLATLSSGADEIDDSACGEATSPTVAKSVEGPAVQQPDGSFTFSYLITVTNSDESPASGLAYSVSDTFAFPSEATVNSITVTGPDGIAINPGFTGGLDALGGSPVSPDAELLRDGSAVVPAATATGPTRHQYRVVVNATAPAGMSAAARSCDLGPATDDGGFSNTAHLTGSGVDTEAQDCTDVPATPATTVQKTVIAAGQASDGSWDVRYAIDVRSDSTTLAAIYDLDDALAYGAGITVDSSSVTASPTGVTLASPAWNGIGSIRIVTGAVISAGEVHHYEVAVNAMPSHAVYVGDSRLCEADGGPAGGGFLNTAQTRSGAMVREAEACAAVPAPELELRKQVEGSPSRVGVGDVVSYIVIATNIGQADYSSAIPADVVDDLSDVIDNAEYRGDAVATRPGTLDYVEPRLSWTGALSVGESVELRYSVRVSTIGDRELRNTVTSPVACPDCTVTTQTLIATPPLASTGAESALPALLTSILALLLGATMWTGATFGRRRTHEGTGVGPRR